MARKKSKNAAAKDSVNTASESKIQQLLTFFEESKVEIKKVIWPSRKETVATCVAVVAVSLVIALYLGIVDLALSKIVEAILS